MGKPRKSRLFTSAPEPKDAAGPKGGKQIAIKGPWVQYLLPSGEYYYYHIITKETTHRKPTEIVAASFRPWEGQRRQLAAASGGISDVFFRNCPVNWDDALINKVFEQFGQVLRCVVQRDPGKSLCHGFLSYAAPECAARAVECLHYKYPPDWPPETRLR